VAEAEETTSGTEGLQSADVRSADDVRIHYVAFQPDVPEGLAVIVVPGFGESGEEYAGLLRGLSPRPAAAVSVRGRGRSEAPVKGYRWEDHVGDVAAVVEDLGWTKYAVVAFSRGSSYALGFALGRPEAVAALVIGDYWARHVGLPPTFVEPALQRTWRGRSMTERMPEHAVRAVQEESVEISLWERLSWLSCPVLLLRPGRRPLLDDATVARWADHVASLEVVELPEATHDLWETDPDGVLAALRGFLERAEQAH